MGEARSRGGEATSKAVELSVLERQPFYRFEHQF